MFPTQWDKTNLNRHSDDKIAPRAVKNVLRGSKAHREGIQEAMPYVAIPVNPFYSSVFLFFLQVWHGDFLWGLYFYAFNVCCRMSQISGAQKCHTQKQLQICSRVEWNCFIKSININTTTICNVQSIANNLANISYLFGNFFLEESTTVFATLTNVLTTQRPFAKF